jgi:hypothetical protein
MIDRKMIAAVAVHLNWCKRPGHYLAGRKTGGTRRWAAFHQAKKPAAQGGRGLSIRQKKPAAQGGRRLSIRQKKPAAQGGRQLSIRQKKPAAQGGRFFGS